MFEWIKNYLPKSIYSSDIGITEKLFEATFKGDLELVKQAIKEGASLNSHNQFMDTPLHIACKWGHLVIVLFIISAIKNEKERLEIINAKNKLEQTPLHHSAESGHASVISPLAEVGADLNSPDSNGLTPLDYAIQYKREQVMLILRSHGAKTAKELEEIKRTQIIQRIVASFPKQLKYFVDSTSQPEPALGIIFKKKKELAISSDLPPLSKKKPG